ncbi:alpha/beta hydrolase [Pseudonocardia nigra]|uniref:alpha/beta hydrolase n=1 Tax=Pseudonocardia nigra TaxID=1921578 RepID=UPI001FEB152A|nr:alpha/beta hydrolase [Pseudonocardia nigra]
MTITMSRGASRGAVVVAAAAAIAVTGCALPASADGPAPPLAWEECGTGFDCATVPVPVDHAEPDGARLDLGLVRHSATDPERRLGTLLVNPGGPGAPADTMVRTIGTPASLFGPELEARYDIVGMDPRGVGASDQVQCLTDAEREANLALDLDPTLSGGLPLPQLRAEARELAIGCAEAVDPALLGQLSTAEVARDMDLVRAALGEERISYLGLSYGTLLGATYATMFPERVQHMVLDEPVHPVRWQEDPLAATVDQVVSAEALLDRYFATCATEGPACPFGAGRPAEAFDALVERLEAQPLAVAATPATPEGRVDGATALLAARTAVFDRRLWPVLTAGLVAAEQGDGSVLYALSAALLRHLDGSPNAFAESNMAVNCLDRAVPADPAAHDRNAERLRELAPRFGTISGYVTLTCTEWPVANPNRFTGPLTGAGAPPILVIGGREDSQTPYSWAEAMADVLETGVLLTRDGVGHGSYRTSGPCVDEAVERYLTTGEAPEPGTVCPQEPAATASPAALGK